MPSRRLCLDKNVRKVALIEIQGIVNVGDEALVPSELDLEPWKAPAAGRTVDIGSLETQVDFDALESQQGKPIEMIVGTTQLLRGTIQKLSIPMAVLKTSGPGDVHVVEIITHKLMFSKRPEPILR